MFPRSYRFIIGLAVLLLIPAGAFAQKGIVDVQNLGGALVFEPLIEAADMILTVTGPCNYKLRRSLRDDGKLVFEIDSTTIDGRYRFEVSAVPEIDPDIIKVLLAARAEDDNSQVDQLCRDGKLPGDPQIQVSGFGILRGQIVYDPTAVEKAAFAGDGDTKLAGPAVGGISLDPNAPVVTKDFVINDDLIVDGSACIGFDCVNGESFGFDTLRLKENNLRIKFDDTSTAASFPRNDWQITANDSANGGASKMSIDDISNARTPFTVEANARSHSLYVDDGGRIGSRTSTPSVEIHTIDGDTPTLRLQQDGSSGFAPQTWDVAGNETNFFVRDVTNGSTLPFRIRPGAPSSAIFIDVSGDVGMGTSSVDEELHIERSDADDVFIKIESTNATTQNTGFTLVNNAEQWSFFNAGNGNFRVSLTGVGTVFEADTAGDVTVSNNLDVTGDLNVTGTKNFAVADPQVPGQWIYFSALEGPEAGTYYRGTAHLVDGEAVIDLPESFTKMTEAEGLTVQLTPMGGWHQLYVDSKSTEQLVVKVAGDVADNVEFDFFVQGVRRGYTHFSVERPAPGL